VKTGRADPLRPNADRFVVLRVRAALMADEFDIIAKAVNSRRLARDVVTMLWAGGYKIKIQWFRTPDHRRLASREQLNVELE
jgi:hypothetical protein